MQFLQRHAMGSALNRITSGRTEAALVKFRLNSSRSQIPALQSKMDKLTNKVDGLGKTVDDESMQRQKTTLEVDQLQADLVKQGKTMDVIQTDVEQLKAQVGQTCKDSKFEIIQLDKEAIREQVARFRGVGYARPLAVSSLEHLCDVVADMPVFERSLDDAEKCQLLLSETMLLAGFVDKMLCKALADRRRFPDSDDLLAALKAKNFWRVKDELPKLWQRGTHLSERERATLKSMKKYYSQPFQHNSVDYLTRCGLGVQALSFSFAPDAIPDKPLEMEAFPLFDMQGGIFRHAHTITIEGAGMSSEASWESMQQVALRAHALAWGLQTMRLSSQCKLLGKLYVPRSAKAKEAEEEEVHTIYGVEVSVKYV